MDYITRLTGIEEDDEQQNAGAAEQEEGEAVAADG